jgi:molybdate transport system permease protein
MKERFTVNRIFDYILFVIFILVFLFLTSPIVMLFIKGTAAIPVCLKSKEVIFSIFLSLRTSLISTACCLLLAVPAAYYVLGIKRLKKIIIRILCIPMSLPHIVSGIALLLLLGRMGMGDFLNNYLNIDFIFTTQGIVLAQIFVNLPFAFRQILASFEDMNKKKIFVAKTLGCNNIQVFYYIIIPLLKNSLLSVIIMTWCRALGEYGAVIMIAGATKMKTEIIPTSIMLNMSTGELDLAIGISAILIIISVTCMIVFEYLFNKQDKGRKYAEN